jgi:hypothetical protein
MVAPVHGEKNFGLSTRCQKVALDPAMLHFAYPIRNWREGRFERDQTRPTSPSLSDIVEHG